MFYTGNNLTADMPNSLDYVLNQIQSMITDLKHKSAADAAMFQGSQEDLKVMHQQADEQRQKINELSCERDRAVNSIDDMEETIQDLEKTVEGYEAREVERNELLMTVGPAELSAYKGDETTQGLLAMVILIMLVMAGMQGYEFYLYHLAH